MSAEPVSMTRLTCDTCGKTRESLTHGATAARIEANAEGWKFAEFQTRGLDLQKRHRNTYARPGTSQRGPQAPRTWDCCPACAVPTPEEAMAIKIRRLEGKP